MHCTALSYKLTFIVMWYRLGFLAMEMVIGIFSSVTVTWILTVYCQNQVLIVCMIVLKISEFFLQLKKKISELESGAIAEKPWQLSGEITAANRPENSLLQENVEFEHTTRLRKFMILVSEK